MIANIFALLCNFFRQIYFYPARGLFVFRFAGVIRVKQYEERNKKARFYNVYFTILNRAYPFVSVCLRRCNYRMIHELKNSYDANPLSPSPTP